MKIEVKIDVNLVEYNHLSQLQLYLKSHFYHLEHKYGYLIQTIFILDYLPNSNKCEVHMRTDLIYPQTNVITCYFLFND